MNGIPWDKIIDLLRFWGFVTVFICLMKTIGLVVTECFGKFCRHCGKKV